MGLDSVSTAVRQEVAAALMLKVQKLKDEQRGFEQDQRFAGYVERLADHEYVYRLLVEELVGKRVLPLRRPGASNQTLTETED